MRISMWMLAEWLKDYQPVVKIQEGERILRNVRLFSDGLKFSRSTVYLSTTDNGDIMCINGYDMLILPCDDINEVFNRILDAFEHYNEWYEKLYEMVQQGCSTQQLLQQAHPELGGLLILADATFYVHDFYGDPQAFAHPAIAQSMADHIMPLSSLLNINQSKHIRMPNQSAYIVDVSELDSHPAVTNLFSNGIHRGWLVICHPDNVFTKAQLDLQDAFTQILNEWLTQKDYSSDRMAKVSMFTDILTGQAGDAAKVLQRLQAFSWGPDDPKQVYVINQLQPTQSPYYAIDRYLEHLSEHSFVLHYNGDLLYLVNLTLVDQKSLEKQMSVILETCSCNAGKSLPFTDVMELKNHYQAARIAAGYGFRKQFAEFTEAAVPYALQVLRDHSVIDMTHPALEILKAYDEKHHTEFYRTVFVFLRNSCSYVETAKVLFIHRSTLIYRLEKIQKLTGLDMSNPELRFHLELSYFLCEGSEGSKL